MEAYTSDTAPPAPPSSTTTLRPARPEDVETIAAIWHRGWPDGHRGNVPVALEGHRRPDDLLHRARAAIGDTTVAVTPSGIIGFVIVVDDEVEQLYVDTGARGSGVATTLLRHGEELVARRFDVAWLAVAPGNHRARRCYERNGWSDAGPFRYAAAIDGGHLAVPCHRYEKRVRP